MIDSAKVTILTIRYYMISLHCIISTIAQYAILYYYRTFQEHLS